MKKIAILLLCVLPCAAMARTNVQKLLSSAQRLQKEGLYLEAMDSATLALRIDEDNRNAKDFVYRNWDNLIRQTDSYLEQLSDMESLEHSAARCETYRLLEEIYNNLREVRMPLYGPNQSWVWQPEIAYYTGHYGRRAFSCVPVGCAEDRRSPTQLRHFHGRNVYRPSTQPIPYHR